MKIHPVPSACGRMKKGTPGGRIFFLRMSPAFSFGYRAYLVPVALTPFGIGLSSIIR